jgi:hypothetical protein
MFAICSPNQKGGFSRFAEPPSVFASLANARLT